MVILFSGRNQKTEKEIIEILTNNGASYISDKKISACKDNFIIVSEYKNTELDINDGIAVMLDDTDRFKNQIFPFGMIGICEHSNLTALELFKRSKTPVISCGMNPKSSVTLSSLNSRSPLLNVQRDILLNNKKIETGEYKIKLNKCYSPLSIMASAVILLLKEQS